MVINNYYLSMNAASDIIVWAYYQKNLIISWNRKEKFHFLINLSGLTLVDGRAIHGCPLLLSSPWPINVVPDLSWPQTGMLSVLWLLGRLLFPSDTQKRGRQRGAKREAGCITPEQEIVKRINRELRVWNQQTLKFIQCRHLLGTS